MAPPRARLPSTHRRWRHHFMGHGWISESPMMFFTPDSAVVPASLEMFMVIAACVAYGRRLSLPEGRVPAADMPPSIDLSGAPATAEAVSCVVGAIILCFPKARSAASGLQDRPRLHHRPINRTSTPAVVSNVGSAIAVQPEKLGRRALVYSGPGTPQNDSEGNREPSERAASRRARTVPDRCRRELVGVSNG